MALNGREPAASTRQRRRPRARRPGHVTLDIPCPDPVHPNGYIPGPQTPGGFHAHQGKPAASPAPPEPAGEKSRADIKDRAQANAAPAIRLKAGERKADAMAPYLDAVVTRERRNGSPQPPAATVRWLRPRPGVRPG